MPHNSYYLFIYICSCDPDLTLFTRDVPQAYVKSETKIKRPIIFKKPTILGYVPDSSFEVDRPLYGILEAGIHWYFMYTCYQKKKFRMHPSIYDLLLMYTKGSFVMQRVKNVPRGDWFVSKRMILRMQVILHLSSGNPRRISRSILRTPSY